MAKSYWMKVSIRNDRDREIVKSWFAGSCAGMTVESAEILCDKETDREKKLRAVMLDEDGTKYSVTRTMGKKTFSVTLMKVE